MGEFVEASAAGTALRGTFENASSSPLGRAFPLKKTAPSEAPRKKSTAPSLLRQTDIVADEVSHSAAFLRANTEAESCAKNPERLRRLLDASLEKLNYVPKDFAPPRDEGNTRQRRDLATVRIAVRLRQLANVNHGACQSETGIVSGVAAIRSHSDCR